MFLRKPTTLCTSIVTGWLIPNRGCTKSPNGKYQIWKSTWVAFSVYQDICRRERLWKKIGEQDSGGPRIWIHNQNGSQVKKKGGGGVGVGWMLGWGWAGYSGDLQPATYNDVRGRSVLAGNRNPAVRNTARKLTTTGEYKLLPHGLLTSGHNRSLSRILLCKE